MTIYHVQRGDTIAKVTRQLHTSWQQLKAANPEAVGRLATNGHWFLREGATLQTGQEQASSFAEQLQDAVTARPRQTRPGTDALRSSHRPPAQSGPPRPVAFSPRSRPAASGASQSPDRNTQAVGRGQGFEHVVQPGETLWDLAVNRYHVNLEELIRDNRITDPRKLQPGTRLFIRKPHFPREQQVTASWYGKPFHGHPMANGQIYDMNGYTIAHKKLPLGTRVELENPATGRRIRAVVTDRGPYVPGRDVDLSYRLAKELSLVDKGVGRLTMRIL